LKNPALFFRRGYSGAGRETLSLAELRRYYARRWAGATRRARWLHRERIIRADRVEPAAAG